MTRKHYVSMAALLSGLNLRLENATSEQLEQQARTIDAISRWFNSHNDNFDASKFNAAAGLDEMLEKAKDAKLVAAMLGTCESCGLKPATIAVCSEC